MYKATSKTIAHIMKQAIEIDRGLLYKAQWKCDLFDLICRWSWAASLFRAFLSLSISHSFSISSYYLHLVLSHSFDLIRFNCKSARQNRSPHLIQSEKNIFHQIDPFNINFLFEKKKKIIWLYSKCIAILLSVPKLHAII